MEKYLILGPVLSPDSKLKNYKGLDRQNIPIIKNSENISDLQDMYSKYFDLINYKEGGDFISDRKTASEIVNVFNKYNQEAQNYQVIQMICENEEIPKNGTFLGVDIMKIGYSGSFIYNLFIEERFKNKEYNLYREMLNENLLFASFEKAKEYITALEIYFNETSVFKPIALYENNTPG